MENETRGERERRVTELTGQFPPRISAVKTVHRASSHYVSIAPALVPPFPYRLVGVRGGPTMTYDWFAPGKVGVWGTLKMDMVIEGLCVCVCLCAHCLSQRTANDVR